MKVEIYSKDNVVDFEKAINYQLQRLKNKGAKIVDIKYSHTNYAQSWEHKSYSAMIIYEVQEDDR